MKEMYATAIVIRTSKKKEPMIRNLSKSWKSREPKIFQISIEPSPFLPHTTMAIENVNIAANAAQPIWKIIFHLFNDINITKVQK